jgi:hypothetical protein
LALALGYLLWRSSIEVSRLRNRYAIIIDAEAAIANAKAELERTQRTQAAQNATHEAASRKLQAEDQERRAALNREYEQALATYKDLKHEISLLEEHAEDISYGLYKPHFNFQTPEDYKTALSELRERERVLIRENRAAVGHIHWTVGSSQSEGNRMVNQTVKLVLRAFNGECEAARADVAWNSITKMEERITKSAAAINKLSSVTSVVTGASLLLRTTRTTFLVQEARFFKSAIASTTCLRRNGVCLKNSGPRCTSSPRRLISSSRRLLAGAAVVLCHFHFFGRSMPM